MKLQNLRVGTKAEISKDERGIFSQIRACPTQMYFVYLKEGKCEDVGKDPLRFEIYT